MPDTDRGSEKLDWHRTGILTAARMRLIDDQTVRSQLYGQARTGIVRDNDWTVAILVGHLAILRARAV